MSVRVTGLVVQVNEKTASPQHPIDVGGSKVMRVRWKGLWGLLVPVTLDLDGFGVNIYSLVGHVAVVHRKFIRPAGFQSGEAHLVDFDLEEDEMADPLELDLFVQEVPATDLLAFL